LQLLLDRLAELRQFGEHVERLFRVVGLGEVLEFGAGLLQPREQLLGPGQ
jgi:hypothetical protein